MPISEKKDLNHQPDLPPKKLEKEQNKAKPSRRKNQGETTVRKVLHKRRVVNTT